jgi:predicted phosphodiesterase
MRSYTNRQGELITVSEEHLNIAVLIKKELQKKSPSLRCSWREHKLCMEKEGFFDSDTNEQYRCMIKDYQKQLGELPEAPKYAEMVSDGKLQSIKDMVGELAYTKREAQHAFRNLNRMKNDIIDFTLVAEQIGIAFRNHDWSDLKFEHSPIIKNGKKMIVCLSDLHIGALVDSDINKFNLKVAKSRMQEYLNKVIDEIKRNEISDVYLVNLGDSIEHPYMHNLAYNSEFVFTEQVAHASDLIIKFMIGLACKDGGNAKVTVAGIAGNHDRLDSDKKKNLDGDHAVKGINKAITSYIENAKPEGITYEQAKEYEHSVKLNGKDIKFVHGDLDSNNDQNLLAKHSSLDGVNYSLILMGHYHHFWVKEHGINKTVAGFGSLKGADGHGEKTRRVSAPSQGIVIIDEDGNFDIKRIGLTA